MIRLSFFLVLMGTRFCLSQPILSSDAYIQTCINKTQCSSINRAAYIFYDETPSELYLKVDFNDFKTENDSTDDWLDDLSATFLYFKAHLDKDSFRDLENNNRRTLDVNGQVFLNGIWQEQKIELTLYSTENSILNNNTSGNNYDNYKVNFSLSIVPRDFKLHKKPHNFRETIFLAVALGRINLLLPGSRNLVGEAYDH